MTKNKFERYAIYFAPQNGTPLAQFGRTWFGSDPDYPDKTIQRRNYGLEADTVRRITKKAERYCFHATMKAPFRLHEQQTVQDLQNKLAEFANRQRAFSLHGLALTQLEDCLVLATTKANPEVNELAALCVCEFDPFRGKTTDQDQVRRQVDQLTPKQRALFEQWGYPYVYEEFRFHMTLTGPLARREIEQITPLLAPALKDISLGPVEISSICLFGDPGEGKTFRLIERHPFNA